MMPESESRDPWFKEILESDYPKLEDFLYALVVNRLNFVKNSRVW